MRKQTTDLGSLFLLGGPREKFWVSFCDYFSPLLIVFQQLFYKWIAHVRPGLLQLRDEGDGL